MPVICGVWGRNLVILVLAERAESSSACEIMPIWYAIELFQMFEVVSVHTLNLRAPGLPLSTLWIFFKPERFFYEILDVFVL